MAAAALRYAKLPGCISPDSVEAAFAAHRPDQSRTKEKTTGLLRDYRARVVKGFRAIACALKLTINNG